MIRCSNLANLERCRRFMEAYSGLDRTRHHPLAYCASASRSLIVFSVATLRVKVLYVLGSGQ